MNISGGFQEARELLVQATDSGEICGIVAGVYWQGESVLESASGYAQRVPSKRPISMTTIFDLASLTKVVATVTAVMILNGRGLLDLNGTVAETIPEFSDGGREFVTVRHLLTHTSGLPSHRRVWKYAASPQRAMTIVLATSLQREIGQCEVYSDLGFIILGEIVQRVSGLRLDEFSIAEIFDPLGMFDTRFLPSQDLAARCASTEDDPWRGRVLTGEVHDENAYALGGVSGHAGLFSTARDLARFGRMILGGGELEGCRVLAESAVATVIANQTAHLGTARGLGWTRSPNPYFGSAGSAGLNAISHTGFTGTSIYIDPDVDLCAVLLTNAVHPVREGAAQKSLRAKFHSAVNAAVQAG